MAGRIDICYVVSSLSRFSAAPRKGHLKLAQQLLGYMKKHKKKGYVVNIKSPTVDIRYQKIDIKKEFGNQYAYFKEDIDPKFPTPLINEFDLSFSCDIDHGHNKTTGRSISEVIGFVGSTLVMWSSKRQTSVQTSTLGAEFVALKRAVEQVV